ALLVSALTGEGLQELSQFIGNFCQRDWVNSRLKVTAETYQRIVDKLGVQAVVVEESDEDLLWVRCNGPREVLDKFIAENWVRV
ncbi:MAG: hypothetical protein HQK84_07340, partial [Nitrospinae bacterium]|nr:hypothetical protein [Nitrospinota bacterium]